LWPGRAKAEIKLVAVNQSSRAGQQGKFRADHQGPLVAGTSQSGIQVGRRKPVIQVGPAGEIQSGSPVAGCGRVLPATSLARAAAVQRIAGIQHPFAVGSVRVWTERPPRVDRSSERPPLMMYFHRSTSGKLSDPLPRHCPAQRIMKRGRPVRRIAWERKNLPSAQVNPSIAR